jgi:hypothetical protein
MAKQYISENPEVLDEIKQRLEDLTPEQKAKLRSAKSKLDKLAENPEAAEEMLGESIINEGSRFDRIIDKIGAFLGLGSILATLLGGLGSLIYGGLANQPLLVIVGIISILIGVGLTNMGGGEEDRNITI